MKRIDYRTYVVSCFHAPIAVFLSYSAMFLVCGEDTNVFNDDKCFNTPRYMHIWCLLNTVAYFMQDLIYLFFVTGDGSAMTYQTYAHHIISILTFYETAFFMNWMMIFGCMLLFVEVSTIFVSARSLMFFHGMQGTLIYNINVAVAFFFFFFGRVVYQIGITAFMGLPWWYVDVTSDKTGSVETFVLIQLAVLVLGSIALNLHWFALLVNTARRALKRMEGEELYASPERKGEGAELVDQRAPKSDDQLWGEL